MTSKDKAKELVDRFYSERSRDDLPLTIYWTSAICCALFAVDEIIDAIDWHEFETPNKEINYWLDVRKEINKI